MNKTLFIAMFFTVTAAVANETIEETQEGVIVTVENPETGQEVYSYCPDFPECPLTIFIPLELEDEENSQ